MAKCNIRLALRFMIRQWTIRNFYSYGPNQTAMRVFLSYRRSDSAETTGRVYDRLAIEFGETNVFRDIDSLLPGIPFKQQLEESLRDTDATLVMIGSDWASAKDDVGQIRLSNPLDYVRLEVENSLETGRPVIPVLVGGAQLPSPSDLPESLKSLTERQSVELRSDPDFHRDMNSLIESLARLREREPIRNEHSDSLTTVPKRSSVISPSRLPACGKVFVDREDELAELNNAWESRNTTIVSIVGAGGTGKTSLVRFWRNQLSVRGFDDAEAVIDWTFRRPASSEEQVPGFNSNKAADEFLIYALEFLGETVPAKLSSWQRGVRLLHAVSDRRILIILDGVEVFLSRKINANGAATISADHGLKALIIGLADGNTGLCVITTRFRILDLEDRQNVGVIAPQRIPKGACMEFLRRLHIQGSLATLNAAVDQVDGFPIALSLLGEYVKNIHHGQIENVFPLELGVLVDRGDGLLRQIIDEYRNIFGESSNEVRLLSKLGESTAPQSASALLSGISSETVEETATKLRDCGLIFNVRAPGGPDLVDMHPILRECFTPRRRPSFFFRPSTKLIPAGAAGLFAIICVVMGLRQNGGMKLWGVAGFEFALLFLLQLAIRNLHRSRRVPEIDRVWDEFTTTIRHRKLSINSEPLFLVLGIDDQALCRTLVHGSIDDSSAADSVLAKSDFMDVHFGKNCFYVSTSQGELASHTTREDLMPAIGPGRQRTTDRLRRICEQLRSARQPCCAANGMVILIPYDLLKNADPASIQRAGEAAHRDVTNIYMALELSLPVTVMIVGIQEDAGFGEFMKRLGSHGHRRFGKPFSLTQVPTQSALREYADGLAAAVIDWSYMLCRRTLDEMRPVYRSNQRLQQLVSGIRTDFAPRLSAFLIAAIAGTADENESLATTIFFSGCYFASVDQETGETAFVRSVLRDKLTDEQSEIEWNSAALKRQRLLRISARVAIGVTLLSFLLLCWMAL